MDRVVTIDGRDYDPAAMSAQSRALLQLLVFAEEKLRELTGQQALLIRARNGYILDLRTEIEGATARQVDASALLVAD